MAQRGWRNIECDPRELAAEGLRVGRIDDPLRPLATWWPKYAVGRLADTQGHDRIGAALLVAAEVPDRDLADRLRRRHGFYEGDRGTARYVDGLTIYKGIRSRRDLESIRRFRCAGDSRRG